MNSTLLFLALLSAFVFGATGSDSPLPSVSTRIASIPNVLTNSSFTAAALLFERSRLRASSPSLSVYPVILIFTPGFSLRTFAMSFSAPYDSCFTTSLPESKYIPYEMSFPSVSSLLLVSGDAVVIYMFEKNG